MEFAKEHKKSMRLGVAMLAGSVVLLLILRTLLGMWSPSGGGSGTFDVYVGPALPLTAIFHGEKLDVTRHVDFDFAPYADGETEIILTDGYALTNTAAEAVTVELAYPFQGSLTDEARLFPAITVNGSAITPSLCPSVDAKGRLFGADDWEDYKAAILEEDYLAEALSEVPGIDTPVTVYHISGIRDESTEDVSNKYLALTYTPDPDTTIWSYNCSDNENEDGTHFITLDVPEEDWQWGECYLLVIGGDVGSFSQQGHHSTFPPKQSNQLDGISATVEQSTSTFGEMVWLLAEHYSTAPQYDERAEGCASPEMLYRGAMARIGNPDYHIFSTVHRILSEIFGAVLSEEVLIYDVFTVTLEPGETASVEITHRRTGSRDHGGMESATEGYDMATRLGSSLSLETQSASLSGSQYIRITEQNFGFNPDAGILSVSLDPEMERYYLRVSTQ